MELSLSDFLEAFIALFVAMNALSVLPLFLGLTDGMSLSDRRRLVRKAITTAFIIALVVLGSGRFIFQGIGITVNDLRIGGGIILLVLSITDLLFSNLTRRTQSQETSGALSTAGDIGVVPLGTPLTVGPAAITTILVLQEGVGYLHTLLALVPNLGISFLLFYFGPALIETIGADASRAIGKVASLFLAAIAVAMIRTGILETIAAL
jgi:multiple antibiotic resistance protein